MSDMGMAFREWALSQSVAGANPVAVDGDHLRMASGAATALINFYPYAHDQEIVEFSIEREDGEVAFFLHFVLDDMARAQELFWEMAEALKEEATHEPTRVLICCTSALTSTLFAQKMNEVAQTLSIDYDFAALSLDAAFETNEEYEVILLAPQAAYVRKTMMEAHPNALVFEIPAKIFGMYDAAGAMRLLMQALRDEGGDQAAKPDNSLRAVRDLHDDKRVLVITLFSMRDHTRLGYRLYDKGNVVAEGTVRKQRLDYRDIEDLILAISARELDLATIDAIGLAVPGITYRGVVSLPGIIGEDFVLGDTLTERFGLPVYVDNNCNAAAVGCYVGQDEYENLLFYRHAFGHVAGGMGTLIDGRLIKGHGHLAGEPKFFERLFAYDTSYEDAYWSAKGIRELALNVSITCCAVVAPDVLYLAVDTIDDERAFRAELVRALGESNAPEVRVAHDYVERVYLGTLALALQKLHAQE